MIRATLLKTHRDSFVRNLNTWGLSVAPSEEPLYEDKLIVLSQGEVPTGRFLHCQIRIHFMDSFTSHLKQLRCEESLLLTTCYAEQLALDPLEALGDVDLS